MAKKFAVRGGAEQPGAVRFRVNATKERAFKGIDSRNPGGRRPDSCRVIVGKTGGYGAARCRRVFLMARDVLVIELVEVHCLDKLDHRFRSFVALGKGGLGIANDCVAYLRGKRAARRAADATPEVNHVHGKLDGLDELVLLSQRSSEWRSR